MIEAIMEKYKALNLFPSIEEILKDAKPSDVIKDINRSIEVSMLKGTYSREYLLKSNMCTEEEYDSAVAYIEPEDPFPRLRYQIVGMETF